uniref:Uncharacterized protein n=1 Tax=Arundo donax TaxID=35708 RepID=A0A0A8XQE6_ARUDO
MASSSPPAAAGFGWSSAIGSPLLAMASLLATSLLFPLALLSLLIAATARW